MGNISDVLSQFRGKYKERPKDLLDLFDIALNGKDEILLDSLIYPGSPVISAVHPQTKQTALEHALRYGIYHTRRSEKLEPCYNFFHAAEALIENGADVNIRKHKDLLSPVQYALDEGFLEAVEICLKKEDRLPVGEFSRKKRIRHVVEWLLKTGMNYNILGYSMLLHFVIIQGDDESFEYALENISDIDFHAGLYNEGNFFTHAVTVGTPFMIKSLIDKGADPDRVDRSGTFPLIAAIVANKPENVQCLLECGVTVNCVMWWNCSPLHFAAYLGNLEIVEMLVINGADVNAKSLVDNRSALSFCTGAIMKMYRHVESFEISIQRLFAPDFAPLPPVYNPEIVKFLLDNGADIEAKDENGLTALDYACVTSIEIVKVLLSRGAKVSEITVSCAANGTKSNIFKFILEEYINTCNSICPYNDALRALKRIVALGQLHPHCIPTLAAFVAKIKASRYVNPNNPEITFFYNCLQNEELYKKCEDEIERMKVKKISSAFNLSFFDILMKNIDHLGGVLTMDDVSEVLDEGHYKNDFSIYAEDLEERIRAAKYRRRLLDQGTILFREKVEEPCPPEIVLLILKSLNLNDLENFAEACVDNVYCDNLI